MFIEVRDVLLHQLRVILDHQQVLRVLLLRCLCEIKRPRDQRIPGDGPYAPESFSP